jgi:hypothetical protein
MAPIRTVASRPFLELGFAASNGVGGDAVKAKVLNTQTCTMGILGFILTAVFGLAARFSLTIFDKQITRPGVISNAVGFAICSPA